MNKKKIAWLISRVFDPVLETPLIIYLASRLALSQLGWLTIFIISLTLFYLIPWGFFLFLLKTGRISDWDISKRKERYRFYTFSFLSITACLLFFYFFSPETVYFYLQIFIPFLIFYLITFFWKISGHMLTASILVLLLYLYTTETVVLIFGFAILILLGWSRIKQKKHTLAQVISGGLLPFIFLR